MMYRCQQGHIRIKVPRNIAAPCLYCLMCFFCCIACLRLAVHCGCCPIYVFIALPVSEFAVRCLCCFICFFCCLLPEFGLWLRAPLRTWLITSTPPTTVSSVSFCQQQPLLCSLAKLLSSTWLISCTPTVTFRPVT